MKYNHSSKNLSKKIQYFGFNNDLQTLDTQHSLTIRPKSNYMMRRHHNNLPSRGVTIARNTESSLGKTTLALDPVTNHPDSLGLSQSNFYNNKMINVKDFASGTMVADPTYPPAEKKYFRVP